LRDLLDGEIIGIHSKIRKRDMRQLGDLTNGLVNEMRAPPPTEKSILNDTRVAI
jgi:hypothetical protein